jgi:hypothetical protein
MSTEAVLIVVWAIVTLLVLGWLVHHVDRLEVKLAELDVRLGIVEDAQTPR